MTTRTRVILLSAAAFSLNLALTPVASAEDKMGKEDTMKKDSMSHDGMKKDTMGKDGMKGDAMSKDQMVKKDDGMMKKK